MFHIVNVESFLPVSRADARVIILGSMPGVASLQAQRYYAHPRNAFWPIVAEICGFDAGLPYELRLAHAQDAGIALWDVLASCVRPGSLDSDIDPESIRTNDFGGFFRAHPAIAAVFCNGGVAFRMFRARVVRVQPDLFADVSVHQLPSTSPAHASMPVAKKSEVWRREVLPILSAS